MNRLQKYKLLLVVAAYGIHKLKRRRWGIHPLNQRREEQGDYNNLIKEMILSDTNKLNEYIRMDKEQFQQLLSITGPYLIKQSNRKPISPACRLMITLRFLATGDSLGTIAFSYRIGKSTASMIISETCQVIWNQVAKQYLCPPDAEKFKKIANDYRDIWNLPNCVGAIDGKHIAMFAPNDSGSLYYNYKKYYSMVLLAVCDAHSNFIYVDIGAYGSQSDGGVLRNSVFGKALNDGSLNLPENCPLPEKQSPCPYYFVGDEAFPLQKHLMRPYVGRNLARDQRIFNYRLCRARRCIENAFGILAARWRILHRKINAKPSNVDKYIKAMVCLHNYINKTCKSNNRYETLIQETSSTETSLNHVTSLGSRNATRYAINLRDYLKDYFNSPSGSVPWQDEKIQ